MKGKGVNLMKKIVVLLLAIGMLLSMAACSPNSGNKGSAGEPQETPAAVEPSATAEAVDEQPTLAYPEKTIHIIVTFSAGGGNDLIARAVASGMESIVGQAVVVDNITGAGGMTGTYEAISAPADGYTILCQDSSLTSMFVTQKSEVPFTLDDMIPVASVYSCPTWALSSAENGYETLQDFIDDAKANPGKLTIGTAVTTGVQYLMARAIVDYFDLDVTIIPYEGGNELKAAVLGNHVSMGIIHSPILLPEAAEGIINVLVAGGDLSNIKDESLKGVKTLADYGMDMGFSSTRGFLVPPGTPDEVVEYLEGVFADVLDTDVMKEFAGTFGYEPSYMNREEYKTFLEQEIEDLTTVFEGTEGN